MREHVQDWFFNSAVSYNPEVGFDLSKYAGKGDWTARGNSVVGAHFGKLGLRHEFLWDWIKKIGRQRYRDEESFRTIPCWTVPHPS